MTAPDPDPPKRAFDPFESVSDAEIMAAGPEHEPMAELTSPFGPGVGFAVVRPATLGSFELDEAEAALMEPRFHPRRKASFTLGRAAASRALTALGVDRTPVGKGAQGQPLWPADVVGSIAHTVRESGAMPADEARTAVAIAVVARTAVSAGLGVDVEVADRPLRADIASRVCLAEELAWVEAPADAEARRRRLLALFIAKEATFKAFYPLAEVFLGFADAKMVWDAGALCFQGELRRDASPDHPAGTAFVARVVEASGLLVSAVQLAPRG